MKLKIQYKIILIFSLISAVILSGLFIYIQREVSGKAVERIKIGLVQKIGLTKTYFEFVSQKDLSTEEIDRIADGIGRDLDLRVTVISEKGEVLGDSNVMFEQLDQVDNHLYRPEVQQALRSGLGVSRRFSNTVGKDLLYVAIPYSSEYGQGVIRLALPLAEIDELTSQLRFLLGGLLFLALLFTALFSLFASQYITKPILEISAVAKSIASGDFSRKIRISTNDEIQDLATSVNFMSKQIKERMEEVVTSRSRFEAVLLSMFEGVMVVDSQSEILLVNDALREILKLPDNSIGKKTLELIRNIEIHELINKALTLKKGVASKEINIHIPDEKTLLVHATPVIREDLIEGCVLVFHNITELRKLETIRKDFVANVSHELRTPITSIKGYAETLLEGAIDDRQDALEFIDIIRTDSDRLAKLVEDILDLSKLESGKFPLKMKSTNVCEIIGRVLMGFNRQIRDKDIKIINEVSEDGCASVLADQASIAQVFLNLIENAIKYNNPQGTIRISCKDIGSFVQFSIEDTGIGIPQNDLPRIFERFYRVDKAHSRQLGGTGLGLSIVKHIIQAHKGEVFAQSVPSKGSVFSFTLPKS